MPAKPLSIRTRSILGALTATMVVGVSVTGVIGMAQASPAKRGVVGLTGGRALTAGSAAQCFGASPAACASTDPEVGLGLGSVGDTTKCSFTETMAWGDKTKESYTFKGGKNGAKLLGMRHTYAKPGTYTISASGTTTVGSCSNNPFTLTFTLQREAKKLVLAALGDSYSSGEGTKDYDPGQGATCHRGPQAWARQLADDNSHIQKLTPSYHLACTGATSEALLGKVKGQPNQFKELDALKPPPTLITMTMGGNDVDFSGVLKNCFLSYIYNCATNGTLTKAKKEIAAEGGILAGDYAALAEAVPSARVVIVGYPQLFPSTQAAVIHDCGWLTNAKRTELNQLGLQLNAVIKAAAATAGVSFVDVTNALAEHEICSGHSWVYSVGLDGAFRTEDGHPTYSGQRAISQVVRGRINEWF